MNLVFFPRFCESFTETTNIRDKKMQGDPDSTQNNINMSSTEDDASGQIRFIKPCAGEVSDGKWFGHFLINMKFIVFVR